MRRQYELKQQPDAGGERHRQDAGHAHRVAPVDQPGEEGLRDGDPGLHPEVPVDQAQGRRLPRLVDLRPAAHQGHQRRQRARRRHLVRARLRRPVRRRRPAARPQAVPDARQRPRRRVRRGGAHLHVVPGQAGRAPGARRLLRPLLQQGPLAKAGITAPPEDDERADGRRQEAHRAQPRRLDQDRRLRAARGVGGARPHRPRARLGRQVLRRPGAAAARHRPRLGERPHVAEAARRLVRLRQHPQVLQHVHRLRVRRQQRLPERQGGDGVRRRVAHGVRQALHAQAELRHGAVPGGRHHAAGRTGSAASAAP